MKKTCEKLNSSIGNYVKVIVRENRRKSKNDFKKETYDIQLEGVLTKIDGYNSITITDVDGSDERTIPFLAKDIAIIEINANDKCVFVNSKYSIGGLSPLETDELAKNEHEQIFGNCSSLDL